MSIHKMPLTVLEEDGLHTHGLRVGEPSQLSDCFRLGMAWAVKSTDSQLAALRADLTEQCRLNAMGQEREARLMAEVAELKRQLELPPDLPTALRYWMRRTEEAERKLTEAERNALERAAKVCEERSEQHAFDMNTSWQAEECAEFIRALMKEGGAQAWSGEVSVWESEK